jgi:3',5'-cyclic-AMP phosphodiesterase
MSRILPIVNWKSPVPDSAIRVRPWTRRIRRCAGRFDYRGVHVIGLVNVLSFKAAGLGSLGQEQLDWLKQDVERLSSSTPIVVFTHIPLWAVYPQWGWVTEDGEQALALLQRFGSVTVLNGHIHQGKVVAHNIAATIRDQPKKPFAFSSIGQLAAIGRRTGVARILGVNFSGFLAW